MAHKHRGHYSEKHPANKKINKNLAKVIKEKAKTQKITCSDAHEIAKKLGVSPDEVGFTMDMLEISIVQCQLGLFGYKPVKKIVGPAKEVSQKLKEEIEKAIRGGKLPCEEAWKISERLGIKKTDVSSACEALGIKIGPCQLGAF